MQLLSVLNRLKDLQMARKLVAIYAHGEDGEDSHHTVGAIIHCSEEGLLIRDIGLNGTPLDLTFITAPSINLISYGTSELGSSVYGADYYENVTPEISKIDSMNSLAGYAMNHSYRVRLWLDFAEDEMLGQLAHYDQDYVCLDRIDQNGMADGSSIFEARSILRLECRDLRK